LKFDQILKLLSGHTNKKNYHRVEVEQLILFDGKYVFKFEKENTMDSSAKHKEKVVWYN